MSKKNHDADVAFVEALAGVLREQDLSEIEVLRERGEDETLNVRLVRQSGAVTVAPPPAAVHAAPRDSAAPAAPAAPAVPVAAEDPAEHPGAVTSPMVGTVYLQPEPGTPPFVSIGDSIAEGDTVCIVEAMKTMNQIPAPHAGTVRRILVEDGTPVEFGSPLVIID